MRAAGKGGGCPGEGGEWGTLMGSGRLTRPSGGPQEAPASGLALGRTATAVVRWADRLREKSPTPCGLPSTPQQMFWDLGAATCAAANKDTPERSVLPDWFN